MSKIFITLLFILFLVSCNKKEDNFYPSKVKNDHILKEIGILKFSYKDSVYISRTADILFVNNNILISDFYEKKIWIFNEKLNLLKIIGGKGKGPGEFSYCPSILIEDNKIYLFDNNMREISVYDDYYRYLNKYKMPEKFIYLPYTPIALEDMFVLSVTYPYSIAENTYFKNFKSLIAVNKKFNFVKNFFNWDQIYFRNEYDAFAKENVKVFLTNGDYGSFFAQQGASFRISLFDKSLDLKKKFGVRPKYFKEPPKNIKFKDTQQSVEANARFIGNTTKFNGLKYDGISKNLFVYYVNLFEDFYVKRSSLWGKHYMQIYNASYDCIYDGSIPGKLAFVNDGKIYILTEERPEYIKFKIFRLVHK